MNIFKFLEEARIPFLDGFGVGDEAQSILFEAAFWAMAFLIYIQIFSRVLRYLYRKTTIWQRAHQRIGVFLGNGRDDAVLMTCMGLHHGLAALLMYIGIERGVPILWRHGYLIETGYEIMDIISMIIKQYPYAKHDGMKDDIKVALFLHHIPGISLALLVMETGLYKNVHMQTIVLALLGGALVSCLCCVILYAMSFQTQMPLVAILFNINVGFFLFCRWWVYPRESFALLEDVRDEPELNGGFLLKLLYGGGVLMTMFNLGVSVDLIPQCVRYIKRAFDGTTLINTEPIPRSRDSVLFGKPGSRRSSLVMAMDAINPVAGEGRRSSIATIMGLNAIEDVIRTEIETKVKRHSTPNSPGVPEEDVSDLTREDLAALNTTISNMTSGKKSQ